MKSTVAMKIKTRRKTPDEVEAMNFMTRLFTLIDSKGSGADCKIDVTEVLQLFDQPTNPLEVPWDYRLALKILLDQVSCFLSLGLS